MKKSKLIIFGVLVFLLSSCALQYTYTYQPEKENTGKVVIIPVKPTPATYIKLNDSLIINNKGLKNLTIENLPEGIYKVQFMSYSEAYKDKLKETFEIDVKSGSNLTHLVSVPAVSNGYWIYAGLITSSLYAVLYMPLLFANQ